MSDRTTHSEAVKDFLDLIAWGLLSVRKKGTKLSGCLAQWPYSWFMDDLELKISNLEIKISMLRKEERRLLMVVGDGAASTRVQSRARTELREVSLAIIGASHAVKELEALQ